MIEQSALTERRKSPARRDFNEIVRDPSGRVSEAKLWANVFKAGLLIVLFTHTETILSDWTLLALVIVAGIAPDLLKKVISAKAGVPTK